MRRAAWVLGLACWLVYDAPDFAELCLAGMYGGGTTSHGSGTSRPAPSVKFEFSPGLEGLEGLSYAAGANIQVTVSVKAEGVQATELRRVTPEFLDSCEVVVFPHRRMQAPLSAEAAVALSEFVGAGGGLLVTHDAVGFRGQPALFPDVCPGGAERVESTKWVPAVKHPLTEGQDLGHATPHSYSDYITLKIGAKGTALADGVAKENGDRAPALVCGDYGMGRYVACGLALGIDTHDAEHEPRNAELRLLLNAVRWLGAK